MADITSKMLDVRIGTSNEWAQENLNLVAGNLYYVDLMKNDGNPSGAMALFLAMGTTKADARYITTLMPSALDASVTGDVEVGDTLVTALSKLNNKITSIADDAAKMFTIRGTIGTDEDGGDRQGIPPTAEKGDAWRIVTAGSYILNGKEEKLEVGDWIICSFVSSDNNTPTWVVLQANLDLSSVTFAGSGIGGDGFEIKLSGAGINASTTVPFATASNGGLLTAGDYGKLNMGDIVYKNNTATGALTGVVTLSDSVESESNSNDGVAATPKAVKTVNEALIEAKKELSEAQKEIVKGIEVNNATHSTDSKKILVQNEADESFHADIHVFAKDETNLDNESIGVRLHTNNKSGDKDIDVVIVNEADHSALTDAIVVEGTEYSVKAVEIEDTKDIRLQSTDEDGIVSVDHADLADDLGGRQETTPEEFIYQPTAGEYQSIKDGMASIKSLKGNSVVWNQKVSKNINVTDSGLSVTKNGNVYTINGTSTTRWAHVLFVNNIPINQDRKYVIIYDYLGGSVVAGGTDTPGIIEGYRSGSVRKIPLGSPAANILSIKAVSEGHPALFGIIGNVGDVYTDFKFSIKIHDLTQMFQEGNEPTTIEEYNARKPKVADEYAYNEGEIISFNGDAIKSVGFNQWDGQWSKEGYYLTVNNGEAASENYNITSYIRVLSNTEYYINKKKGNYPSLCFYDINKKFISGIEHGVGSDSLQFTTPSNCAYVRESVMTSVISDFCINLSHTGFRNGEYEPYTEHTLYLPKEAQDMKSAGAAYDEIYFDEAKKKYFKVQRMGEVDLGDLVWDVTTNTSAPKPFFTALVRGGLSTLGAGVMPNIIVSNKYNVVVSGFDATERADKSITWARDISTIFLYDYDYTDVESLKAALKGIKLIYQLAEPIITEITDYEGYMDYPVSDFGTEEVLSLGNTAPLKADIQYGFNAVDTIRNNRLDITQLKKDVVNANATANEAKSRAENAEDYAEQANNLSNDILDDIKSIKLSTEESDGKVKIFLDSDGITVGNGQGGYEKKAVDTEVQIPNATTGNYGLMSPGHVGQLNALYKPTAIGAVTSVTDLKTKLDTWLNANKGKIVAATFQCGSDWRTNWSNPDKQDTAFATGSTTWTAQVIAAYSTDANHVCLMISSYSENNQYIVYRAPAEWSGVRQIAFIDSKVNTAALADKATLAEKATNDGSGNNIADTYLPKSGGKVTGSININDQLTIDEDGHLLPQQSSVTLGSGQIPFESAHISTIYGYLSGSAYKALRDANDKEIIKTYAKATDLDAIKSALTWKPFTNSSN